MPPSSTAHGKDGEISSGFKHMWGEEGEGTLLSSAKGFKLYRSANMSNMRTGCRAQRKEEECGGWLLEGALVNEPIAAEDSMAILSSTSRNDR